ncbi:MAG TPA: alpha/beta hydrolase [Candidatus Eisenbacteria bacterium]|jgi:esterase/lipase superfamily enzyme
MKASRGVLAAAWLAAAGLAAASCAHAPPRAVSPVVAAAADTSGESSEAGALTLFYVTDRAPAGRPDPRRFFGREWGELAFGRAAVRIPPRERLARLARSGRSLRSPGTPIKQVVLESLTPMSADSFLAEVAAAVGRSKGRRALVFVHGYNMPFERALRFTAQLERGLGESCVAILYGWPATRSYLADEEAVRWSEPDLEAFLTRLADRIGAGSIDLLGYSMGTRAVMGALGSAAVTPAAGAAGVAGDPAPDRDSAAAGDAAGLAAGARFGQVVLAAPDLESRTFARDVPRVARAARRLTLYASSRDRALRVSRAAHGHARAGQAGRDLLLLPGLDTIDVTEVRSDLTGHGYLEELIGDLELLLGQDTPPDRRPGLTRATSGGRDYWRMSRK